MSLDRKKRKLLVALIAVITVSVALLAGIGICLSANDAGDPVIIDGYDFGKIGNKPELNIMDYGADNTGAADNTKLMRAIHKTGKRIYYPNGTYLFTGVTLDLSGGVRFESADGVCVRNKISDMNILRFDDFGNLIGLMQNHLELTENSVIDRCGSLVSPPLSQKNAATRADILTYWYNDFGLQCTKQAKTGWIGWYYWSWNHHNAAENPFLTATLGKQPDPYDPARHPLLGFYYGDDPVVLDWQCYWLSEYNARNVILLADDLCNWEKPVSTAHWIYQMFHHAPNFRNIRYAFTAHTPWVESGDTEAAGRIRAQWQRIADTYAEFSNYYSVTVDGKSYPVITLLEEKALVGAFDNYNGCADTRAFLFEMADYFQSKGFPGFVMLSRNPYPDFETDEERAAFRDAGIIRFESSYTPTGIPQSAFHGSYTYSQTVDIYQPSDDPHVIQAIATSLDTQTPHESGWKNEGTSPADFKRWIEKAIAHLDATPDSPRIITCYNLSEWAEGGPGLQPNVKDGFGYLKAFEEAVTK